MSQVSVLTLVKGRVNQLKNLVRFLEQQTQRPDELVVACMDDLERGTLTDQFPVKVIQVSSSGLPLARARNEAAAAAGGKFLIFLDVDCIPSSTLVESYSKAFEAKPDAAFMGEVLYLPEIPQVRFEDRDGFEDLKREGVRHPSKREFGKSLERETNYGELWGLSFALGSDTFRKVGGFDERFERYGAEETDFARALEENKVPLFRCPKALALHQHHHVHIPPVQHFDSIVENAQRFRAKWGKWCMDYWLGQFQDKGWIDWKEKSIDVLRRPTDTDLEESRQGAEVRFS